MGRFGNRSERHQHIKMHLVRANLDSGGYDEGGAYWGIGEPLYWAYGDGEREMQETFVRGSTREKAKENVRKDFPNATFYR